MTESLHNVRDDELSLRHHIYTLIIQLLVLNFKFSVLKYSNVHQDLLKETNKNNITRGHIDFICVRNDSDLHKLP